MYFFFPTVFNCIKNNAFLLFPVSSNTRPELSSSACFIMSQSAYCCHVHVPCRRADSCQSFQRHIRHEFFEISLSAQIWLSFVMTHIIGYLLFNGKEDAFENNRKMPCCLLCRAPERGMHPRRRRRVA